jgi:hypothetical protein
MNESKNLYDRNDEPLRKNNFYIDHQRPHCTVLDHVLTITDIDNRGVNVRYIADGFLTRIENTSYAHQLLRLSPADLKNRIGKMENLLAAFKTALNKE